MRRAFHTSFALLLVVGGCARGVESGLTPDGPNDEIPDSPLATPDAPPVMLDARLGSSDAPIGVPDAGAIVDARPGLADARAGLPDAPSLPDAPPVLPDAPPGPPDAPSGPPDAPLPPILVDTGFNLGVYDSGNLTDKCANAAPFGPSWGIGAGGYADPDNDKISAARFQILDSGSAYLYGKDDAAHYSFVRYTQGDVWGSVACGSIGWHQFPPLATAIHNLHAGISVYRDTDELLSVNGSWLRFSVNVWLTSPDMPRAGMDRLGRKPLLLEFVLYQDCNIADCSFTSTEQSNAFHFQTHTTDLPAGAWLSVDIPISEKLADAVALFELEDAEATLAIYQIEFQIQVRNAIGAAMIDDFTVVER